jgi:DNA-binding CsgD family transcriptional regulator
VAGVDLTQELERGRSSYGSRSWRQAYEAFSRADRAAPLDAADLELYGTSASMIGRDGEYLAILERAHDRRLEDGDLEGAVRNALWLGVTFASAGEIGQAGGWLGRAARLLDRLEGDRVERGYLLLPTAFEHEARGDWDAAVAAAGEAAAIGERFGDADLFALATHLQGHILIEQGRGSDGLRLLDEAMLAVTTGRLSPIVSGIVYCGVILACQIAFELRRAQEWTAALTRWCESQSEMVAFTGRCMVHRAEIMQVRGAWPEALREARRAADRCIEGENPVAAGEARYREGEVHRLRGEAEDAERAYREASALGREPQPGLALLRLAQGKRDAAGAAIRRVLDETEAPGLRLGLLPAAVEIALATGDLEEARAAGRELDRIAAEFEGAVPRATAAQALGAVELAAGDARRALAALRRAEAAWREVEAPYELARVRELIGAACRALGDVDTAKLELEAALGEFERLGAVGDLARCLALADRAAGVDVDAAGLTARELQVLRMVAAGETNRAIATELVLSVRTVDRHVSNIFAKLGVSSRAGATDYAHRHGLV